MQNSDKLNKKGSGCLLEWPEILHTLKRTTRCYFQTTGLARGIVAHFLGCFRDLRALRTYPIYSICYYPEGRNEGLYLRKNEICPSELGLALAARISMKVFETYFANQITTGISNWTRQLDSDDGHRLHPIILVVKV